jgi:hypothetical protein
MMKKRKEKKSDKQREKRSVCLLSSAYFENMTGTINIAKLLGKRTRRLKIRSNERR